VPSNEAGDIVHGELYRLRARDDMLREFDMYEACGEGFEQPTEYLRRLLSVALADGTAAEARTEAWTESWIDAWSYVYNWPVGHLPRIASGRFLEH
jgi:gamma-glutamylcyclotransferase (GGCT)/AIG2-like uncharacterized protein YtfP